MTTFSVGSFDEDETVTLGHAIEAAWEKQNSQFKSEYAISGWELSILPEICCHVSSELIGEHWLMIVRVVEWLHPFPCPNDQVEGDMTNIIDFLE